MQNNDIFKIGDIVIRIDYDIINTPKIKKGDICRVIYVEEDPSPNGRYIIGVQHLIDSWKVGKIYAYRFALYGGLKTAKGNKVIRK